MINYALNPDDVLSVARLTVRLTRVPATLPSGGEGNVLERAFENCLIGMWRVAYHDPLFNSHEFIEMSLAEALVAYLEEYPEDEGAPALRPFHSAIQAFRDGESRVTEIVAAGHYPWIDQERWTNPEFRTFLALLRRSRRVHRAISVPGRPYPQQPENDVEHSMQLALLIWYLGLIDALTDRVNIWLAIVYAIVHDLLEAPPGAGDTPVAGSAELLATKHAREETGRVWIDVRIPWLGGIIRQYELLADDSSRAVKRLDKVLPIVMTGLSGGDVWRSREGFSMGFLLIRLIETCPGPDFVQLGITLSMYFTGLHGPAPELKRA